MYERGRNEVKSKKIEEFLALENISPKDSLPKGLQAYIKSLHPELKTLNTRFAELEVIQRKLKEEIEATKEEIRNGSLISFNNFSKINGRGPSIDITHNQGSHRVIIDPPIPFIDMKSCKFGSTDLKARTPKTFDSLFALCIDRFEFDAYRSFCSPKMQKYCQEAEFVRGIKLDQLPDRCRALSEDRVTGSLPSLAPAR
ncbi:MAG: hypothetical protein JNM39_05375 [Bdellovibrionaceae bacterium]|nr:hypothetical protein [Pseudobdellovibrionaceae bacterium]